MTLDELQNIVNNTKYIYALNECCYVGFIDNSTIKQVSVSLNKTSFNLVITPCDYSSIVLNCSIIKLDDLEIKRQDVI